MMTMHGKTSCTHHEQEARTGTGFWTFVTPDLVTPLQGIFCSVLVARRSRNTIFLGEQKTLGLRIFVMFYFYFYIAVS